MSRFFFVLGVIFLVASGYLTWQRYTPTRLALDAVVIPAVEEPRETVPTSVEIEDLGLALPVESRQMSGKKWPVSDKAVVYLSNSPIPGDQGNSILYGHNWPNLLGRLTKIKPGAMISVGLSDATRRQFVVKYTQEVTPDQTHILAPTDDSRITLYTCSGFFDQKRFVVTAIAEGESTNLQISKSTN